MTPQDVVAGLRGTAAVSCEAVAEGLRSLAAGPDVQRGMRAAQRAVDIVSSLSQRCARLRAPCHWQAVQACFLQALHVVGSVQQG